MTRAVLEHVSSLLSSDADLHATLVHERKRDAVAGLSRAEVIDRMLEDYTVINRPVAVRGRRVACGPLKLNRARYESEF